MSSLAFLMQNYSDSEDDGSSDEERKRKRLKRRSRESIQEEDLNEAKESETKQDEEERQENKLTDTSSPEITPTLDRMKLDKLNEQQQSNSVEKPKVNYHQDYLEDDFFTVHDDANYDELDDANDNSNPSIIDDDTEEQANNEAELDTSSTNNRSCDHVEKLDCSQHHSPKSFHRLLIGIDEENIQIPDAPNKQCSEELTQNIINYHNKMKQGMDMNKSIQSMKSFRNPSIYEKLITYCNIDEFDTNLPPEIFDPDQFREKESAEHDIST